MTTEAINPLAPHHLPWFIVAPGETDYLFTVTGIFLLVMIVIVGNLYFQLHSLPERRAHHHTSAVQMEIVAVLALLALFTHNHVLWIAALLLAFVQIPDFSTPIYSMAESLDRLAKGTSGQPPALEPESGQKPMETRGDCRGDLRGDFEPVRRAVPS